MQRQSIRFDSGRICQGLVGVIYFVSNTGFTVQYSTRIMQKPFTRNAMLHSCLLLQFYPSYFLKNRNILSSDKSRTQQEPYNDIWLSFSKMPLNIPYLWILHLLFVSPKIYLSEANQKYSLFMCIVAGNYYGNSEAISPLSAAHLRCNTKSKLYHSKCMYMMPKHDSYGQMLI